MVARPHGRGGPAACDRLYRENVDRIEADSRPKVWTERQAGLTGAVVGGLIPLVLLACSAPSGGPTVALLAAVGAVLGIAAIRWSSSALELVDAWAKSRWRNLKSWAFQLAALALALGGVIIAVLRARPAH